MNKFFLSTISLLLTVPSFTQTNNPEKPNYASLEVWAAHPYKADFSDKQPKDIAGKYATDTSVDVFFIHPTSYTKKKIFGQNASVFDKDLNEKTDEGSIQFQASVFNSSARVFAPRYRQAHLSSFFPTNFEDSINALKAFELAYADVKDAFEYYLKNYNNGRPIIIASHSQGTFHARNLIKEFFDGTTLQNQLVAAYLVGYYVPKSLTNNIKECTKPNSTGCIVSWRTFEYNYLPEYVQAENQPAVTTNPITWDIDKPTANKEENKGILKKDFNDVHQNLIDANVVGNVVWVTKPKIFGIGFLNKNYHVADYNFFYESIKQNVADRIKAFWEKRKY
ncbi:MAG: DUF3089 domain-containing protein [Chitinophagaceae bacterium]